MALPAKTQQATPIRTGHVACLLRIHRLQYKILGANGRMKECFVARGKVVSGGQNPLESVCSAHITWADLSRLLYNLLRCTAEFEAEVQARETHAEMYVRRLVAAHAHARYTYRCPSLCSLKNEQKQPKLGSPLICLSADRDAFN